MAGGPENQSRDGQHQRHQEHRAQLHRGQEPHGGWPRGHVIHLHHGVKQLQTIIYVGLIHVNMNGMMKYTESLLKSSDIGPREKAANLNFLLLSFSLLSRLREILAVLSFKAEVLVLLKVNLATGLTRGVRPPP